MGLPCIEVKNDGLFSCGKDVVAFEYCVVVMETVTDLDLKTLTIYPETYIAQ